MKKILSVFVLASLSSVAFASGGAHWGYTGDEAPDNWGALSPDYHICGEGKNQSPIDIKGQIEAELSPIEFKYSGNATEVLNNGHTIQANFPAGSSFITVDNVAFELKQIHFHTPSENHVDGKSFPMEAHMVHADKDGNLAVVGFMLEEGAENPALAKLWAQMPENAGDKVALTGKVSGNDFLPKNRDYYRFNGSLTTPPCSEGVRWLVMKTPVQVSKEQVEAFAHVMHHPNNRPVQQVNARPVLK